MSAENQCEELEDLPHQNKEASAEIGNDLHDGSHSDADKANGEVGEIQETSEYPVEKAEADNQPEFCDQEVQEPRPHTPEEEYPAEEPKTYPEEEPHNEEVNKREVPVEEGVVRGENKESNEDEFPPHTQEVHHLVKPRKTPLKKPTRWDPIEYDLREDSDDEFEMATALRPVYEEVEDFGVPNFKNGEPDYQGEYLSCFDEPNLLYRILNREEKTWAFYNDTRHYEMHVRFIFGKNSVLEALENTKIHTRFDGEHVAEVFVYPGETEMFIKGRVNGFTSKLRAVPLSEEYHQRRQEVAEDAIQREVAQIKAIVGDERSAEKVLEACLENNLPFVDLEFPPCQASLDTGAKKPFKHLPWARPSSYLPDELLDQVRLFRGPIRPSSIDQGELGDAWLMCSIAAISENPQSILKMFRHPVSAEIGRKERAIGAYRVTFNKNGLWRSVIVDNYLPISGGKPKYAKSTYDLAEIWPSILEKAFAKLHGSYAHICSGDPLHAIQDLTGYSYCRFDDAFTKASQSGKDDLFQDWLKYNKAHYQMMLSTPGKDPNDKGSSDPKLVKLYQSVGLISGHAYTVLDTQYFADHELRLVKLRNAWGRTAEWNGDWCGDDEKWEQYPDVAEACKFQKDDNSAFWMSWEACLYYFNGGGVSFSHPSLNDYRVPSKFVECTPSCVLEVSVEQPTWICFTISQQDRRGRQDAVEYQPVMLSIAQPLEKGLYKVVQNSSADAYSPSCDKWIFLQARDVSLIHKFLPEHSPYLVIPRLMSMTGQEGEVPYALGFSCNRVVGHDGVTVQFKALDKENKVMHNFPKFDPEATPVVVDYQVKSPHKGYPEMKQGQTVY
ncbi:calpain-like cysteine peptidase [Trypanosoma cruzi Dm28c]|uniref:Calpain-like cysteine peptidase n=1 Tax=Trypanosoma cruzi Dm28c TaxID=1416333 RepID=V5B5I4_TRYCR|nr:calpain-like cysteine peptidase [Trypanosoma cruzi Dm28c]